MVSSQHFHADADATEIQEFVREQLASILQLSRDELSNDRPLTDLIDSIMLVTFMLELEQQYSISYKEHELLLDNFSTIGRITEGILGKRG